MVARADPDADPTVAFTAKKIKIIGRLIADSGNRGAKPTALQFDLSKLARLEGYFARTSDPPPGNTEIWRGLRRVADIQIGAEIAI